jgi:hypothetical protein
MTLKTFIARPFRFGPLHRFNTLLSQLPPGAVERSDTLANVLMHQTLAFALGPASIWAMPLLHLATMSTTQTLTLSSPMAMLIMISTTFH